MKRAWAETEIAVLQREFPHRTTREVATILGRTEKSVYLKAHALGMRKTAEHLASENSGRIQFGRQDQRLCRMQFKPGHTTWNKGLKGHGTQEGCRATQFKPGRPACEARNYAPIGTLRLSKDGYLERKVTDDPSICPARRWVGLHRLVWEQTHGAVPAGHIVVFKPGMKTTDAALVTADRLDCITRRENMLRNTYHRYGPGVAQLIQLRGAITRQINKRAQYEQDPQ